MDNRILIGNIEQSSVQLITDFVEAKVGDVRIDPLTFSALRAKVKTQTMKPDVLLVILDESAYNACADTAGFDEILKSPKLHKYVDRETLKQFLISKFGSLDGASDEPAVEENTESKLDIDEMPVVLPTHTDDEVDKLKAIIDTKDMIIENLNNQLKEISSGGVSSSAEVTILQNKISELEILLKEAERKVTEAESKAYADLGKVTKAEELINEVKDLHSQLNKAKEDLANADFEKNTLNSKIIELNSTVSALTEKSSELDTTKASFSELQEKYNDTETKLHEAESQVNDLTIAKTNLANKVNDLNDTVATLESKVSELDIVNQELQDLKQKNKTADDEIKTLKEKSGGIESLNLQITHLKLDLDNANLQRKASDESAQKLAEELSAKETEYTELSDKYDTLAKESDIKDGKVEELNNKVNTLNDIISTKESEFGQLQNKVTELNRTITEKENQIKANNDIIEELKASVTDSQENTSGIEQKNKELSIELGNARSQVKELEDKLTNAKSDLEVERKKREDLNTLLTTAKSDASASVDELNTLKEQLKEKDVGIQGLRDKLSNLQTELNNSQNTITAKDAEILDLNSQIKKLGEEIESVKAEAESKSLDPKEIEKYVNQITDLEIQVSELKRTEARLNAEKDALNRKLVDASDTSEYDNKIANLESQITDLKVELANKPSIDASEVDQLQERISNLEIDLSVSRDRAASLEIEVSDRDSELQELHDNIFLKLSDCSRPTQRLPLALPMPVTGVSNLRLFASGTQESALATYETIKKIVTAHSDKNYIILDIVTDTLIDSVFETKGTVSARSWLCDISEKDKITKTFVKYNIKDSLIDTKYKNVKILSTATKYFNSLALFSVKWRERLPELCRLADYVIVNVGNLDDVIHMVVYNSISSVAKGYIITKTTPINIRSVYYKLQSMQDTLSNTVTYCVGMNEMSKQMYKALAKEFKTEILDDSKIPTMLESR